jgi:hypothetical protein
VRFLPLHYRRIEHRDGAWDVAMEAVIGTKSRKARGTGATFAQAWDTVHRIDWE